MKNCGTKPNRKSGIYSRGRRGRKEAEDAVGTLWLRLGEDQNKRKTEDGSFFRGLGGSDVPPLCFLTFIPKRMKQIGYAEPFSGKKKLETEVCKENKKSLFLVKVTAELT